MMIRDIKIMLGNDAINLEIDDTIIKTIVESSKKTFKRLYSKIHHSWNDELMLREDTLSWVQEYSLAQCKQLIGEIRSKPKSLEMFSSDTMLELAAIKIASLEDELSII